MSIPHRLSVAPMMARTDRHFRYLMRLIAPNAWLYTEMVTARAVLHSDYRRILHFDETEHPVALQLGGSVPSELARAARIGQAIGYDEVNLNVGCPSGRVQCGSFGVALMRDPERVADCLRAMRGSVRIPVTVKTRLGVDDDDSYEFLCRLVESVRQCGCHSLILHARKAWLHGLSPKENRTIPPLDYQRVHRIKADFPDLEVVVNGGLTNREQVTEQLEKVDGVMLGRAAYESPMLMAELDHSIHSCSGPRLRRAQIAYRYLEYMGRELDRGGSTRYLARHMMGLYAQRPGARQWRRAIGEMREGQQGLRDLAVLIERLERGRRREEDIAA